MSDAGGIRPVDISVFGHFLVRRRMQASRAEGKAQLRRLASSQPWLGYPGSSRRSAQKLQSRSPPKVSAAFPWDNADLEAPGQVHGVSRIRPDSASLAWVAEIMGLTKPQVRMPAVSHCQCAAGASGYRRESLRRPKPGLRSNAARRPSCWKRVTCGARRHLADGRERCRRNRFHLKKGCDRGGRALGRALPSGVRER